MQTPMFLHEGNTGGFPRVQNHRLHTGINRRHDELGKQNGFGFVRVSPADHQSVSTAPIFIAWPEVIKARIPKAWCGCHIRRGIVEGKVRGIYMPQGILGNRVGILDVLVRVSLHTIGRFTVLIQHVLANFGRNFQCHLPGHRLQGTAYTDQRLGQTVTGRIRRVVNLLGDHPAAHGRIAIAVDMLGVFVRHNHDVMRLTFMHHHIMLRRCHPGLQWR